MQFKIDDEIFERFPGLTIGVVVAKGIDNSGENSEVLSLLEAELSNLRERVSKESIEENPHFVSWREAFRSFGAKPKKYRCSVENLYRMTLDGVKLGHISTIVDLYNAISLKYGIPVGGDDLDHIDGGIRLSVADGTESFTQLNSEEVTHPKAGEVVYRDHSEVLCRRWNWRECDKSKMTEASRNVSLVLEGLPPVNTVAEITAELGELVGRYCGGEVSLHILNSETREVSLS